MAPWKGQKAQLEVLVELSSHWRSFQALPLLSSSESHVGAVRALPRGGRRDLHRLHPSLPIDSSHIKSQSRALIEDHKFNGLRAWQGADNDRVDFCIY